MSPFSSWHERNSRQIVIASVFIAVLVFALYGEVLRYGFVWDDQYLVDYDERIRSIDIPRFFSQYFFRGDYYRPLTLLSLSIDWFLYGKNPAGFHLTNILLHICVSIVLLVVFRMIIGDVSALLAGAVVFAVHPVHVENIAFISARSDILVALFYLLSFASYLCFRERPGLSRYAWLSASLVSYALSLFSKEMAITLPVILILFDALNRKKIEKPGIYALFVFVFVVWFVMRYGALGEIVGAAESHGLNRMLVPGSLWTYVELMLLPVNGQVLYLLPPPKNFFSPEVMWPLSGILVLLAVGRLMYRKNPDLGFGILFFFVTLLPVSNIVPLHPPVAERFAYLPSVGFALILMGCATRLRMSGMPGRKVLLVGIAVPYIALLSWIGVRNLSHWKDNITLWESVEREYPGSPTVMWNLAQSYFDSDLYANAIPLYRKLLVRDSSNVGVLRNLGESYLRQGKGDSAEIVFTRLIAREPSVSHYYLAAKSLLMMGDTVSAQENLSKAVHGGISDPGPYIDLAEILLIRNKQDSAQTVLHEMPDKKNAAGIIFERGNDLLRRHNIPAAAFFWRHSIAADSLFLPPYKNLASLSAYLKNFRDAQEYWKKIVSMKPDEAEMYLHWARIKVLMGQPDSAVTLAKRGREIAVDEDLKRKFTAFLNSLTPCP